MVTDDVPECRTEYEEKCVEKQVRTKLTQIKYKVDHTTYRVDM